MIMSSYLMDSNYIDPKFPPCEEYSQNNYIPDHSPEYYSRTRESSYQHHHPELYPFSCGSIQQAPGNPAAHQRGHGQTAGGQQHLSEKAQQLCEQAALSTTSTTPSPAPPACNQPNPDHPNSTASKQPVVYPWMKKIHVSTGMQLLFSSSVSPSALVLSHPALSLPLPPPPLLSLSLSLFFFYFLPFHERLWVSTIELDLRLRMGNYTHHKFYSRATVGSLSHVVRSVMYV
ncbi:hypothetical protein CIB84_017601 [Bambusicola thoracicus]|uniref:Homeobox domain-containing protein n=1 Tax=Bambusicola thoracicus TaxID=9083 RepID=A0A2P4S3E4_BAMTH|nr:hypothetical protein CIB84_017601 [Bambusicola thoracicus]